MPAMADRHHDRTLHQAAARSPELAAMLASKHDDPSQRYRRLALLVSGAAVSLGLLWIALSALPGASRPAPEKRGEPAEEIDTSHYLSPLKTAASGGEEVAPFSGFAVSVDTDPPGGIVTIGGVPRGEAPVLANLECKPGAKVAIAAEKAGFRSARAETTCRTDTLVKLTVRLAR
jgi:hypothetical protein